VRDDSGGPGATVSFLSRCGDGWWLCDCRDPVPAAEIAAVVHNERRNWDPETTKEKKDMLLWLCGGDQVAAGREYKWCWTQEGASWPTNA
jgi:hypothetical protein